MLKFLLRLRIPLLMSSMAVIVVFSLSQDLCVDVWAHALHGRVIVEQGHLPRFGDYSVQGQDVPQNRDTLPSLLFFALLHFLSYPGLLLYKLVVIGLTALFIALQMRERKIPFAIISLAIACFAVLAESRFLPRADSLNMVFLAIFLFLLTRHRRRGDRLIWLLPLVQLLWVQFHDLSCLGIFIPFLYALEEILSILYGKWRKREIVPITPYNFRLLKIAALCLLFSFANEATYYRVLMPFLVMRDILAKSSAYPEVMEFRSVFSNLGMAIRYLTLLVITTLLMLRNFRRLTFVDSALVVIFAVAGAFLLRFAGIYAVVVIPITASYLWEWAKNNIKRVCLWRKVAYVFAFAVNLSLVYLVACGAYYRLESRQLECNPHLSRVFYPVRAVKFIEQNRIYGNIYGNYNIGGFLGYHLYPRGKIFIHSLCLWYSKDHYQLNRDLRQGKISPQSLASIYDINAFVLIHGFPPLNIDKRIILALHRSREWFPVYVDETTIIYLRKNSAVGKRLSSQEVQVGKLTPDNIEVLSLYGNIWLGDLVNMLGYYSQANKFYTKAAEKGRVPAGLVLRLARFALKDGNCEQALSYLAKAAKFSLGDEDWQSINQLLQIIPNEKKQGLHYQNILQLRRQWQARKSCHSSH